MCCVNRNSNFGSSSVVFQFCTALRNEVLIAAQRRPRLAAAHGGRVPQASLGWLASQEGGLLPYGDGFSVRIQMDDAKAAGIEVR
jgi:hypothetical protein